MKVLSGTFAFVALAITAIVTLPSCSRKQVSEECPTDKKFCLKLGTKYGITTEYVEVDKTAFDKALCSLKKEQYVIDYLPNANATPIPNYTPSCSPVSINTDKITTSEVARAEAAEESSAYDPNAVYRVTSNNAADIENVLHTFKASPTPTPF